MAKIENGDIFTNSHNESVVVIDYLSCVKILVEFLDENKARKTYRAQDLRNGSFKNPYRRTVRGVGYIGQGKYLALFEGVETTAYSFWSRMMNRCYSGCKSVKNVTYLDCTVSSEWHNFQEFAEWFYNYPKYFKGYELDKDILVKGNKIYSYEACCLVPKEINSFFTNISGNSGVYYNKDSGNFVSRVSVGGKRKVIGRFDCKMEALKAYKKAKEAEAKILAEYWKEKIDVLVYDKLINWEFS